jgi:5'-3' exonuclease
LKKGGLEDILTEAGKLDGFIVSDKNEIVWSYINQLLNYLGSSENDKIFDIVSNHYNKKKEVESDPFEHDMLFKIDRKKWRTHYYKELFYSDSSVIMTSCDLYLRGLLWTYLYYKKKPKDNMWYYPYNYAPTMTDVHNYLNSKLSCYETLEREWKEKFPKDIFCEPIVQLLSILPRHSIDCIPLKYKKAMENPTLDYLYPKEYKIQTFMKTKLWECSQVLPPMNIELVASYTTSLPKTSS